MRVVTKGLTNKVMNSDTYVQKRKVMEVIYELKQYINLPRITVKITESHGKFLGMGTMDKTVVIWITEEGANLKPESLMHLVAHEIGHAVFKMQHRDTCPLMKQGLSMHSPASLETIIKVLGGKYE